MQAAENAIDTLRNSLNPRATAVQQIVVEADDENADISSIVKQAHDEAATIKRTQTSFVWPSKEINAAVAAVRLAQGSAGVTAEQKSVLSDLSKEVSGFQSDSDDTSNAINQSIKAIIAWQPVLSAIQPADFTLPEKVLSCPKGAYADNATVSFVAIDRTLVKSAAASGSAVNKTSTTSATTDAQDKSSTDAGTSGGATGGGQGSTPSTGATTGDNNSDTSDSSSSDAAVFKKDLLVLVGPSRITSTHGIGYSNIPNRSWKTGTTMSGTSNVTQIQPNRQDSGQPFLMTQMVHYRLTSNPSPWALHATFAITTSQQQFASGMIGLSASLNQSFYFSLGIFRADVNSLNGYMVNQIVPSGTSISTTSQATNRFGFAFSIPIFPTENGNSTKSPQTSTKNTKGTATSGQTPKKP